MKVLALSGSPRKRGNSSLLLQEFLKGAESAGAEVSEHRVDRLNIKPCLGCLKCSIYKECVIKDDDWPALSREILEADTIVFAAPIYFHHFPGPVKTILDRFRSFISVTVQEKGLLHTPWVPWKKRFVLLLTLGSPLTDDAKPVIDLFRFIAEALGPENSLEILTATCLQMSSQIKMNEFRLSELYTRMELPADAVQRDFEQNQKWLNKAYKMGEQNS